MSAMDWNSALTDNKQVAVNRHWSKRARIMPITLLSGSEFVYSSPFCCHKPDSSSLSSGPYSEGPLKIPFQRPAVLCRKFSSSLVEKVIDDVTSRMVDKDLAQIFRNAFPNTLDTTVRWHVNDTHPNTESEKERDGHHSEW